MSGNYENDNEWSIINGMRRDAKMSTVQDGGSRETMQIDLASTAEAGGVPSGVEMRLFFKYGEDDYHRYAGSCCTLQSRDLTRFLAGRYRKHAESLPWLGLHAPVAYGRLEGARV